MDYSKKLTPPGVSFERREGKPKITMLQTGKLIWRGCQSLCLIRNISSGGMMATLYWPLPVGERIRIEFKSGDIIDGYTIWVDDEMTGIEFETKIDVEAILAQNKHRETPGERARRLRVDVNSMIRVWHEDESFVVQALDVSQGGIKVQGQRIGGVDDDVLVRLPGLAVQPGVIRWHDNDCTGISLNRMLTLEEVTNWAKKYKRSQPVRKEQE